MSEPGSMGDAHLDRVRRIRRTIIDLLIEVDEMKMPFMVYLLSLAVAEMNFELRRELSQKAG